MWQQARNQRHTLEQWPIRVASVMNQLNGVIADLDHRLTSLEQELAEVLRDMCYLPSGDTVRSNEHNT